MGWREAFDRTALSEPLRTADFETFQRGRPETIVDRVASISYVAAMSEARRQRVLDEVRDLLASDPDTKDADVIELPYRAHIYWTHPTVAPPFRLPLDSVDLDASASFCGAISRRPPRALAAR